MENMEKLVLKKLFQRLYLTLESICKKTDHGSALKMVNQVFVILKRNASTLSEDLSAHAIENISGDMTNLLTLYTSKWDDGTLIVTTARFNRITGRVFDVVISESVPGKHAALKEEYIEFYNLKDGRVERYSVCPDCGDFIMIETGDIVSGLETACSGKCEDF